MEYGLCTPRILVDTDSYIWDFSRLRCIVPNKMRKSLEQQRTCGDTGPAYVLFSRLPLLFLFHRIPTLRVVLGWKDSKGRAGCIISTF